MRFATTPEQYTIWTLAFLVLVIVVFGSMWAPEAGWRYHFLTAGIAIALVRLIDWCLAQVRARASRPARLSPSENT